MRIISLLSLLLLLSIPDSVWCQQLMINEYSASNVSQTTDNFGDNSDWVEIYNPGSSSVSLVGYYLSDNANNPTKWMINGGTIGANGVVRIWCSGRNIQTGTLHANFKLTQCKPEEIVLANPSGVILDSLTMKRTQTNHSRGRTTNGAATWSVFITPTPNAANAGAQSDYVTRPGMNVTAGFYGSAQSVTITCPDPNVTIRYTTNGNMPTASSTAYTGPINISATTVLRARAFSSTPNTPASFVESNTYFINSSHTIPVLSIFGDQVQTLLNGNSITAIAGLEYFDKTGLIKTETQGETNEHGNDSWAYNQRGIDFVSRDEHGYNYALTDQIFSNKPRTEFQRIIIKAGANDNYPFAPSNPPTSPGGAHVRDAYAHTLSQLAHMHMDERTSAFCVVYINGQYWGVYDYREKVDDHDFTDYYFNQNAANLQFIKCWGWTWEEYGSPNAIPAWNNLVNFIMSNNMGVAANYNYVDSLYNLKSLCDYFIMGSYSTCADWLNWNTAWWRGLNPAGNHKKWRYTLWDLDATWGHYINYTSIPSQDSTALPCDPNDLGDPGGNGHVPVLNKLLSESQTFKSYYVNRYIDLLNNGLSCTRALAILDSMVQVITPEMPRQIQRWGGSVASWNNNVSALRSFIANRCQLLFNAFLDPDCSDDFGPLSGPYRLVLNVDPPNSGNIQLNSTLYTAFSWSGTFLGGPTQSLLATANSGYVFSHWENFALPNVIQTDTLDSAVTVILAASDSIVAHFVLDSITTPPPPPPPPPVNPAGAFYIPTAFSPNNDGNNDFFQIYGGDVKEFELIIYDRWGNKIFSSTDQSAGWNGEYKGDPVNTGIYAYQMKVKFGNGDSLNKSGNIALMR
ncbi:MAG: CotH kinase family protein [Bacteroidia bacterium]|nr:CotH kinase family protein [Bacteroidia bacterium]